MRRFCSVRTPLARSCSSRRQGMAALEYVMIIGAIFPVAVSIMWMVFEGLRRMHEFIASVCASPVF